MRDPAARRRALTLLPLLALGLLAAGCGKGKLTQKNYDRLEKDMTVQEVEALLGPGTKDEGGDGSGTATQFGVHVGGAQRGRNPDEAVYVWESPSKTIRVRFLKGKMTDKFKEGF